MRGATRRPDDSPLDLGEFLFRFNCRWVGRQRHPSEAPLWWSRLGWRSRSRLVGVLSVGISFLAVAYVLDGVTWNLVGTIVGGAAIVFVIAFGIWRGRRRVLLVFEKGLQVHRGVGSRARLEALVRIADIDYWYRFENRVELVLHDSHGLDTLPLILGRVDAEDFADYLDERVESP